MGGGDESKMYAGLLGIVPEEMKSFLLLVTSRFFFQDWKLSCVLDSYSMVCVKVPCKRLPCNKSNTWKAQNRRHIQVVVL